MDRKNVLIVGGGIAGIYCAWRLSHDHRFDITLIEGSSECGGRILSLALPGLDFPAELGAMRFRKNHVLLRSIIDELKLHTRPFDIPPPKLFLRGRHLTLHDMRTGQCDVCGAGIPFHLHDNERGKSAEDLVRDVIYEVLKGLSFPTLHQTEVWSLRKKLMTGEFSPNVWLAVQEHGYYGNSPLYAVGFWNLLQHFLSNEAFQMVHDILSLESVLGNWSAAEAIPWFLSDFSNQELSMLPGGMQAITTHLVYRLALRHLVWVTILSWRPRGRDRVRRGGSRWRFGSVRGCEIPWRCT